MPRRERSGQRRAGERGARTRRAARPEGAGSGHRGPVAHWVGAPRSTCRVSPLPSSATQGLTWERGPSDNGSDRGGHGQLLHKTGTALSSGHPAQLQAVRRTKSGALQSLPAHCLRSAKGQEGREPGSVWPGPAPPLLTDLGGLRCSLKFPPCSHIRILALTVPSAQRAAPPDVSDALFFLLLDLSLDISPQRPP